MADRLRVSRTGGSWCATCGSSGRLTPPARQFFLSAQSRCNLFDDFSSRNAPLLERVAIAERDGLIRERLPVDGHAPGSADFVLPAITFADRRLLIVIRRNACRFELAINVQ